MSEADKPRKVRVKDLAAGIVITVIGIIFIIVYIIITQLPYAHHLYYAWLFPILAVVFILIGIVYFGWKIDRIKRGKI